MKPCGIWRIRGQRLKGVDQAWRRYKQRKDNGMAAGGPTRLLSMLCVGLGSSLSQRDLSND